MKIGRKDPLSILNEELTNISDEYKSGLYKLNTYIERNPFILDYLSKLEDELYGYTIEIKEGIEGNVLGTYDIGIGDIKIYLDNRDEKSVFLAYESLLHESLHALQDKYAEEIYINPFSFNTQLFIYLMEAQANIRFGLVREYDELIEKLSKNYGIAKNIAEYSVAIVSSLYADGVKNGLELGSFELDKYVAMHLERAAIDKYYRDYLLKKYIIEGKNCINYFIWEQSKRYDAYNKIINYNNPCYFLPIQQIF